MDHILIFKNDLAKYPPIITIIDILLKHNYRVAFIGYCSDINIINKRKAAGLTFYNTIIDDVDAFKLGKLFRFFKFKQHTSEILMKIVSNHTQVWFFGIQTIWLLHSLVRKYNSILYLFELPNFRVPFSYKIFCSLKQYKSTIGLSNAKVVCCEYNRAHITKSYFNLKKLPYIIPNKPIVNDTDKVSSILIDNGLVGKKIILYQGIFNYPERRLDEFCEAINLLPDEYVLVLMGGPENEYRQYLKKKYVSSRIVFIPFLSPPNHLIITKSAYIGILTYFPCKGSLVQNLNTLFCAPNKLYEYSFFGVPMISNDIPALDFAFNQYQAGICVRAFEPKEIAEKILYINNNYNHFKAESLRLYKSVDIERLIIDLVEKN